MQVVGRRCRGGAQRLRSAKNAGLPPVECYRAGVAAWKRFYPDQAPEYAAKRAVSLILEETTELTIRE